MIEGAETYREVCEKGYTMSRMYQLVFSLFHQQIRENLISMLTITQSHLGIPQDVNHRPFKPLWATYSHILE